ncbi:MAG: Type 1 glutamine amidotransferase-like domain-containing protein [Candidatus Moranbacteria bacterium]|nr:Type 1 glutamine amidotransferase-like domain-containing protein [Candidatus Moranbacteria bacterium]
MRKLLLSSNGSFIIENGFGLLFDDISKIKLAYIITASKGVGDLSYLERHKEKLDNLGIDYEEIDIEGKNEDQLRDTLKNKNVVYVEGGNTFYLLKAVRESGFGEIIKELINSDVTYIGSSAGAYIVCPTIEMATWKPKQKDRFGVTDFTALNLVPFLVTAHYIPELESVLKEKIAKAKYPTRILQDGQGILVEDGEYKFVGEGEEVKFNKK